MMSSLRYWDRQAILLISLAIGGSLTLNGCERASTTDRASSVNSQPIESAASLDTKSAMSDVDLANKQNATARANKAGSIAQRPQLIKTAELSLRLESIDKMMAQLRQIVQSKQGDIYDFQDDRSGNDRHRQVTLVLKVPSKVLDATVAEIAKLGRVESQGMKISLRLTWLLETG